MVGGAISPSFLFESEAKRDRFLSLVSEVADHAVSNEPQCKAYCWFRSSSTDVISIRGFEVYSNEEALNVVHRASEPYKRMRQAIMTEKLAPLPTPSDLKFRTPAAGFLTKGKDDVLFADSERIIVTSEYFTSGKPETESLLKVLKETAESFKSEIDVLSFWALKFEDVDNNILLFEQHSSRSSYERLAVPFNALRKSASTMAEKVDATIWIDSGIGFIRGSG